LAVQRLAELDLAEDQPAEARKRFEALLKREPQSVPALLALAEITRLGGGTPTEVRAWLDKAVLARPLDPQAWLGALAVEQRLGRGAEVVARAQRAAAALPGDADIQLELGRTLLANADRQQALRAFRQVINLRPHAALPRLVLADALVAGGDLAAARKAVDQALEIEPRAFEVERAHAVLLLREKRLDEALNVVQARRKRVPQEAESVLLEADVRAVQGQPATSLALLHEALALNPSPFVAGRISDTLRRSDAKAATAFEQDWLRRHPKDATFIAHLAQGAVQRGEQVQGVALYRRALEIEPRAALVLNNLAVLLLPSRPAEALELAQRAVRLMPNSAPLLDTLAQALGSTGQVDAALTSQSRAVELDPQASGLRLTLARLQIKAGNKRNARDELVRLAALGEQVHEQAEVKKLLAELDR
jgi:putative PEP-CTERM system TPR-repeat lipoprotein